MTTPPTPPSGGPSQEWQHSHGSAFTHAHPGGHLPHTHTQQKRSHKIRNVFLIGGAAVVALIVILAVSLSGTGNQTATSSANNSGNTNSDGSVCAVMNTDDGVVTTSTQNGACQDAENGNWSFLGMGSDWVAGQYPGGTPVCTVVSSIQDPPTLKIYDPNNSGDGNNDCYAWQGSGNHVTFGG